MEKRTREQLDVSLLVDNLLPGESDIYCTNLHWISFWSVILGFLLVIACYVSQMSPLGHVMLIWAATFAIFKVSEYRHDHLCVTNKRIFSYSHQLMSSGLAQQMFLEDVDDIRYRQSSLGRLLRCGTVTIDGPSVGGNVFTGRGWKYERRSRQIEPGTIDWRGVRSQKMRITYVWLPVEFVEQARTRIQQPSSPDESLHVGDEEKLLRDKVNVRWRGGGPGCLIAILGVGMLAAGAGYGSHAVMAAGFVIAGIGALIRHAMED